MVWGADMKTVILNASAKHDGNGNYIAEKLAAKYTEGTVINLTELEFCNEYRNKLRDSAEFVPEMVEEGLRSSMISVHDANLIILIAPNYFNHVSGITKMFLDRFHVFLNRSGRSRFQETKKFFFIYTQGSANRSHGQSTLDWMKGFCNMFGFKFYGVVVPSCKSGNTDAARIKMEEITMSLSMFL